MLPRWPLGLSTFPLLAVFPFPQLMAFASVPRAFNIIQLGSGGSGMKFLYNTVSKVFRSLALLTAWLLPDTHSLRCSEMGDGLRQSRLTRLRPNLDWKQMPERSETERSAKQAHRSLSSTHMRHHETPQQRNGTICHVPHEQTPARVLTLSLTSGCDRHSEILSTFRASKD